VGITEANDALLESWELQLGEDAKRPRTIKLYLDEVHRFARWLADHDRPAGTPGDLEAVARADVQAWLADQRARGLSQSTMRSRWIALRSLYGWALAEEVIETNPLARVTVRRADAPPPEVIPDDDLRALLKVCAGTGFYERRDSALFRFMLATGLRVSEVVGLRVDDLDLRSRVVRVVDGKGGKARMVRFDPGTAAAVDRYRRARARHRLAARPELWLGFRGPLSRKGVPTILDKRTAEAGIGHLHPHQFRHTWASRWLTAGGNEGDLQRLGGWENSDVMRRYGAAQATDRALAAYDTINPMEGL